ncbi:MAG: hypothetical protein JW936_07365 [Sedimentisphaerales bacterium]|nr:hypothetical protein [Sedimentisphaerales bacterium]
MDLQNNLFVVSLTHWDREWRFPFEKTRMLLVEMMDELLDLLDNDPEYQCFHLDGQTILLEDYCQVRPEAAERISKHVKNGRILIGPWFVLPEENQMSGESLVRNFLIGESLGRKYGGNMKVGYSPTSWGQVSQMPQIMNGCGIDSIIFYRGISADQVPGNYYIWQGPDGSKLLGIRLGDYARASFFHLVDRPTVFNRRRGQETHEWKLGGKPFRMCGTGSASSYHFHAPPSGWHPENIEAAFEDLEKTDLGKWETPYALAMECDDSTGPFVYTPRIIAEANKLVSNGKKIVQGSLTDFVAMAREALNEDELTVLEGEMRHPQRAGVWTDLYAEVQATRMPMKYANRRAEFAVQRVAEPLAAIAWSLGDNYPTFALDRANYTLLQNHAHDSIGGCGRDSVNDSVEYRFSQVKILANAVTEDAVRSIAGHIDSSALNTEDLLLVVFNSCARERSAVVRAEIDLSKDRGIQGFRVQTLDGDEVPGQVIAKSDCLAIFNHPHEIPCRMRSDRWELYFEANDIPAVGYKVFKVQPAKGEMRHPGSQLTSPRSMANEYLEVTVNSNGTVDVVDRETGEVFQQQNLFVDQGDIGDYWVGAFPTQDRIVNSSGCHAEIAVVEDGKLSTAIEARLSLNLPIRARLDKGDRDNVHRAVNITTTYKLLRGERFLRIATTIENTVEDHILRAFFATGVDSDVVHAEVPFDVIERAIPLPDTRDWREPYRPVQPQQNFVDISNGKRALAVLNRGLPQYEAVDDPQRSIALTLLRAHKAWNSIRLAHYPDQSGTQLQGTYTFEYALMPHAGDYQQADVIHEAEKFNVDPVVGAAGPGEGSLPTELSFLQISGKGLVMNACKKGHWDDSLIIRLSNPTTKEVKGRVKLHCNIAGAESVNMLETEVIEPLTVKKNSIDVTLAPKKVMTLRIELQR